jgi:photosystem II stability/assembly factor-like uncharacterized protein
VEGFTRSGNRLLAATALNNIHLTCDGGENWIPLGAEMTNHHIYCLAYAGKNLLAGGTCTSGGIDMSDNNGASWTRVSDTLNSYGRIQAEAFAIRDTIVYAAGNGIWKSANAGRAWTSCNLPDHDYFLSILFIDSTVIAAGPYLTISTDGGQSWNSSGDVSPSCIAASGNVLYSGLCRKNVSGTWGRPGLFRSSDKGKTWQDANIGLTDSVITEIAASDRYVFALTENHGVFFSEDSGTTWTAVNKGLPITAVTRLIYHEGYLYAGTAGSGVWRCALSDLVSAAHPPKSFVLEQNYPNPFNGMTTIRYGIPKPGIVTLRIYDLLGKRVATLVQEEKDTGNYTVRFNAADLPSGTYRYRLEAGGAVITRMMTIVR